MNLDDTNSHLFIGSIDFNESTLLISGTELPLLWLADQIESRQETSLRQGHPPFVIFDGTMTLIAADSDGRLDEHGGHYEWRISDEQVRDFAERLRVLARAAHGHQYLDTESSLQIVASKGEYDLNSLIRGEPRDE